jgi:hypothetical protein
MIPQTLAELLRHILIPITPSSDYALAACPSRSEPLPDPEDADDFDLSDASALGS